MERQFLLELLILTSFFRNSQAFFLFLFSLKFFLKRNEESHSKKESLLLTEAVSPVFIPPLETSRKQVGDPLTSRDLTTSTQCKHHDSQKPAPPIFRPNRP